MNKDSNFYKKFFLIKEEDIQTLKEAGTKLVEGEDIEIVHNQFVDFMINESGYEFSDDVIAGVQQNKEDSWNDVIVNPLNDNFVPKNIGLGQAFAAMGVPIVAYVAVLVAYYKFIAERYQHHNLFTGKLAYALKKQEQVHIAVVSDVYHEATNRVLQEQNEALSEMSTPVTQLWDGILLLPLVGYIDSKRAQDTMTTMLDMIAKTQAKVFILDISGVAVVDTAVANYLIRITKATRLMGCTCLISGISGSVAQTIVELGIQIDEVTTTGTMKEALNHSLQVTGAQVVKLENY